jgi:hypothetical protein
MLKTYLTLASTLLAGACTNQSDGGASLSGSAVYRDAATDHDGATQRPATPPAQSAHVTITVKGSGQIPNVDPKCALDPAGQFEAQYLSTMSVTDGNVYSATVASGSGAIETPSGCAIPDLTVSLITDVVIRSELSITTQNCDTYCSASARADAEAQCGATASAASCRTQAEADAMATCQTTCTTKAHAIVAEMSLGAALLGDLDVDSLRAAALGDLHANLMFDHLEDANGNEL